MSAVSNRVRGACAALLQKGSATVTSSSPLVAGDKHARVSGIYIYTHNAPPASPTARHVLACEAAHTNRPTTPCGPFGIEFRTCHVADGDKHRKRRGSSIQGSALHVLPAIRGLTNTSQQIHSSTYPNQNPPISLRWDNIHTEPSVHGLPAVNDWVRHTCDFLFYFWNFGIRVFICTTASTTACFISFILWLPQYASRFRRVVILWIRGDTVRIGLGSGWMSQWLL